MGVLVTLNHRALPLQCSQLKHADVFSLMGYKLCHSAAAVLLSQIDEMTQHYFAKHFAFPCSLDCPTTRSGDAVIHFPSSSHADASKSVFKNVAENVTDERRKEERRRARVEQQRVIDSKIDRKLTSSTGCRLSTKKLARKQKSRRTFKDLGHPVS